MYVGEQYSIVDIQAIEIIERWRMVADGDGSIIWPSQGWNRGSIPLGSAKRSIAYPLIDIPSNIREIDIVEAAIFAGSECQPPRCRQLTQIHALRSNCPRRLLSCLQM